ncbi:MAG: YvcK family protein [Candidatus Omnitrophota bacterium]
MRWLKWLYPGMKVKRWIFLFSFGILLVMISAGFLWYGSSEKNTDLIITGSLLFFCGVTLLIVGIRKMVKSFVTVFIPRREKDLVDIIFRQRQLSKGPKIVVLGGGTGLSVLLHGLKDATSNITAIVTVADDGGSSGRLRNELNVLPPGDIRNCLVALADAEPLMRDLFQFRFTEGDGLKGHNFGNLFITALSKVTGDFEKAIKESSRVLAIRGQVVPSTLEKVVLSAKRADGTQTMGESAISKSSSPIKKLYLSPAGCKPTSEAVQALREADIILIGPGSLYTSILPNLLVTGIVNEISRSRAIKIYVCNVMTQHGETDGYSASDHVDTILKYSQRGFIDYVLMNTAKIPEGLLLRYKEEDSYPVEPDAKKIRDMGIGVAEGDFVEIGDYVRHDADKITKVVISLLESGKAAA